MNENLPTTSEANSEPSNGLGSMTADLPAGHDKDSHDAATRDELDRRFVAPNFVGPAESSSSSGGRERKKMFCFECNRQEGHFIVEGNRWVYSFLIGLTFGLIYFIGPYTCQCCGAQRLFRSDRFNPGYWIYSLKYRSKGKGKSRRRRSERRT